MELLLGELPTGREAIAEIIQERIGRRRSEARPRQGRQHQGRRNHRVAVNGFDEPRELPGVQPGTAGNFRRSQPAERIVGARKLAKEDGKGVVVERTLAPRQRAQRFDAKAVGRVLVAGDRGKSIVKSLESQGVDRAERLRAHRCGGGTESGCHCFAPNRGQRVSSRAGNCIEQRDAQLIPRVRRDGSRSHRRDLGVVAKRQNKAAHGLQFTRGGRGRGQQPFQYGKRLRDPVGMLAENRLRSSPQNFVFRKGAL